MEIPFKGASGLASEYNNCKIPYRKDSLLLVEGDASIFPIILLNNKTGDKEILPINGAFIFIGLDPNTGFLAGSRILLDQWGFVTTGHALLHGKHRPQGFDNRDPYLLETSVPGVFAAGDVRDTSTKQVVSAAGEGGTAALEVREYLKSV